MLIYNYLLIKILSSLFMFIISDYKVIQNPNFVIEMKATKPTEFPAHFLQVTIYNEIDHVNFLSLNIP